MARGEQVVGVYPVLHCLEAFQCGLVMEPALAADGGLVEIGAVQLRRSWTQGLLDQVDMRVDLSACRSIRCDPDRVHRERCVEVAHCAGVRRASAYRSAS